MIRIVPRFQRVTLAGEYADVWLDLRVNPPMRVFDEFSSRDLARIRAALRSCVQASNLEDEDGQPIDLRTDAGWQSVPSDFLNAVAAAFTEAISGPKATKPESGPSSVTDPAAPPSATP